jgi:broad-specificity NMP kinase
MSTKDGGSAWAKWWWCVLSGNPGTGKTTVAKRMGAMFHALGILPGEELVIAKPSDFVTGYVGQAGHKTKEMLRKVRAGWWEKGVLGRWHGGGR